MANQRALLASYLINQSANLVNVLAVWTQRAMLRRNLPKLQGRRRNIGSACFNTFPPPGTSWLTRRNSLNNQRLPSKSKSSVSCREVWNIYLYVLESHLRRTDALAYGPPSSWASVATHVAVLELLKYICIRNIKFIYLEHLQCVLSPFLLFSK
jgi:hypothetical protein